MGSDRNPLSSASKYVTLPKNLLIDLTEIQPSCIVRGRFSQLGPWASVYSAAPVCLFTEGISRGRQTAEGFWGQQTNIGTNTLVLATLKTCQLLENRTSLLAYV